MLVVYVNAINPVIRFAITESRCRGGGGFVRYLMMMMLLEGVHKVFDDGAVYSFNHI